MRREKAQPAGVSHLRKAEVAFTASAATSSTGLLTASWRARAASPHMAELVNNRISSGCLENGRSDASQWRSITRNKAHVSFFSLAPSRPETLSLCLPGQDLSKQQQALLVQLSVGHLQASLKASHHCLNAYPRKTHQRAGRHLWLNLRPSR